MKKRLYHWEADKRWCWAKPPDRSAPGRFPARNSSVGKQSKKSDAEENMIRDLQAEADAPAARAAMDLPNNEDRREM